MQHAYGKPLHRSTIWRRIKRHDAGASRRGRPVVGGLSRRGRRQHSEPQCDSFTAFVAGVVSLLKDKGHVHYADLLPRVGSGNRPIYYPSPEKLLRRLAQSGFPPEMQATAVCELVPLNLVTRGGPDSTSANNLLWKARASVNGTKPGRLRAALKADGLSEKEIELYESEIAKLPDTEREPILAQFLNGSASEENRHLFGLRDSASHVSCKGTPVHRVDFIGTNISRAMASYWRNHRQFKHCKKFLRELMPDVPSAPYREAVVTTPKLFNAVFKETMRRRMIARQRATASK